MEQSYFHILQRIGLIHQSKYEAKPPHPTKDMKQINTYFASLIYCRQETIVTET